MSLQQEKTLEIGLKNKRVLITGGLGMIGSTIAHICVEYGAKVTLVDSFIEPFGANYFNIHDIKEDVNVNICDIRDKESMKILVRDQDIIFNLAGQISHNDSLNNPSLDAEINYLAQMNVMENVKLYNPDAIMVFSGSRLQFGPIKYNPVDEQHPLTPQTPYAFHKTMTEYLYDYYNKQFGIKTIVFRIANPYGIRCQMKHAKYAIINYFLKQAICDDEIKIFGDGHQLRDYIFVEDLAEIMLLASINKDAFGHTFNLGSGIGTSFKSMVETIVDIVKGGKLNFVPWPENYVNVETGDYITDISKIKGLTNWSPKHSLEEGIKKSYAFYKEFGHNYYQK
jgi:UDP-glucose 4-epimerase